MILSYQQDFQSIRNVPKWEKALTSLSQESLLDYLQKMLTTLPLFQFVNQKNDFSQLEQTAAHLRQNFKDVIILGTGGSSLGGQALYSLSRQETPKLHFHDNIDSDTFERLFAKISPTETAVIAISKSGNTAETLMQLLTCLQHWSRVIPESQLKEHFWIIAENQSNGIREIAQRYDLECLDHPMDINGRVAVFTLVGLLPALIAGLDAPAVLQGAKKVLAQLKNAKHAQDSLPLAGAMVHYILSQEGYTQSVVMPYVDRLNTLALWYRQLWAESLGKQGKGTTPINAVGTIDQHSQLQLYLDGPKDKFFTIITGTHPVDHFVINAEQFQHPSLVIFQDKSMGQLMMAEQQATIDTLHNNQCPTRVIHLENLTEEALGALMMHFVVETIATAYLLKVNPFDQPAVEESKILTRHYLAEM
jgi:glucose-6-phosphate isomerase